MGEQPSTMAAEQEDGVTEYLYKVLVVGDIGTGKTSIIKRYVHNIFSMHYKSTIGVDFALKVINWDPKTIVRLQLWDIAGQERFGNMTRVYYKEAVGAFVVFDVTRVNTFEAVQKWKNDIDNKVTLPPDDRPIPVVLLANKCEHREGRRRWTRTQEGRSWRLLRLNRWKETSIEHSVWRGEEDGERRRSRRGREAPMPCNPHLFCLSLPLHSSSLFFSFPLRSRLISSLLLCLFAAHAHDLTSL